VNTYKTFYKVYSASSEVSAFVRESTREDKEGESWTEYIQEGSSSHSCLLMRLV